MLSGYLRQATATQARLVGPFLDDTDFKTAKTGLTIANTDVKLSANGGAGSNKNSGGGTHRNNGMYSFTFDATDTATVGELSGSVVVASALPVVFKFAVLEEAVYDVLMAPGALSGNSAIPFGVLWAGTLSAISSTSVTLPGGHNLDHEGNYAIVLTAGTNAAGKSRYLTYSGAGEVWTVDPAWNSDSETTPSGSIAAMIVSAPKIPTTTIPNVNTAKVGGTAQTGRDLGASVIAASVTGSVGSVAAGGLDAVLDAVNGVDNKSLRQTLSIILAMLAGKRSGLTQDGTAGTAVIRNLQDTKNRVSISHDGHGNLSSVTFDLT